jgi:hypothetical protein
VKNAWEYTCRASCLLLIGKLLMHSTTGFAKMTSSHAEQWCAPPQAANGAWALLLHLDLKLLDQILHAAKEQ